MVIPAHLPKIKIIAALRKFNYARTSITTIKNSKQMARDRYINSITNSSFQSQSFMCRLIYNAHFEQRISFIYFSNTVV